MSENVTDNISTNIPYNIPTAVPIISSYPKITLVCRNCNAVFQRPASVSPAHNEYADVISAEESGQWIFYRYVSIQ